MTVGDLTELTSWVLGWGKKARVVEPEELVDLRAERIALRWSVARGCGLSRQLRRELPLRTIGLCLLPLLRVVDLVVDEARREDPRRSVGQPALIDGLLVRLGGRERPRRAVVHLLRADGGQLRAMLARPGASMQSTQDITIHPAPQVSAAAGASSGLATAANALGDFRILRRNGAVVAFEPSKITVAMTKAFLAVHGGQSAASASVREIVEELSKMLGQGTGGVQDMEDQSREHFGQGYAGAAPAPLGQNRQDGAETHPERGLETG